MFKYTRPRTHLLLKRASGWLVVRCVEALKQYAARYSANVPHHPRSVVSSLSGLFLRTLQNIIAANFCFRRLCGILPSSTSSPSPHCSYMHTFFVYMYVCASCYECNSSCYECTVGTSTLIFPISLY